MCATFFCSQTSMRHLCGIYSCLNPEYGLWFDNGFFKVITNDLSNVHMCDWLCLRVITFVSISIPYAIGVIPHAPSLVLIISRSEHIPLSVIISPFEGFVCSFYAALSYEKILLYTIVTVYFLFLYVSSSPKWVFLLSLFQFDPLELGWWALG